MATTLLYITQPKITNPPPEAPPQGALAWFARWSSGHLCHADQDLVDYAASLNVYAKEQSMDWPTYQRLLAESHWYEH
jgi:hypothetical protein